MRCHQQAVLTWYICLQKVNLVSNNSQGISLTLLSVLPLHQFTWVGWWVINRFLVSITILILAAANLSLCSIQLFMHLIRWCRFIWGTSNHTLRWLPQHHPYTPTESPLDDRVLPSTVGCCRRCLKDHAPESTPVLLQPSLPNFFFCPSPVSYSSRYSH